MPAWPAVPNMVPGGTNLCKRGGHQNPKPLLAPSIRATPQRGRPALGRIAVHAAVKCRELGLYDRQSSCQKQST